MKQNLHNIFNSGACPSSDDLQLYLRGSMSSEDANALEQHVESCELCADALEGLQAFKHSGKLDSIKAELDLKVDELLKEEKNRILFSGWNKIAAAVAILVMVGGVLFLNNQFNNKNEKIFTEHYKPFEKKDKKVEAVKKENLKSETSDSEETVKAEAGNGLPVEDDIELLEDVTDKNTISLDAEPALESRNELAIPSAPPAVMLDKATEELQTEEQSDVDANIAGVTDDADEVSVRGGRDNSTDYYVDGIKVQDKEQKELTTINSVKTEKASVIEEVVIAKDSKLKQGVARKNNKNAAKAGQATTIGIAEQAYYKGAIVELININYKKGEEEYNSKNYEQASLWFQKVLELDAGHYHSNFYAGLCALQLGQAGECIHYLALLLKKEKEILYEPSLWYISLAHIKMDDKRKAKKYLKKIIPLNGEYKSEAEKLLNEL